MPIHPGKTLLNKFLRPKNLTRKQLAYQCGVSTTLIGFIIAGERSISANTAHRFAAALDTTPEFWLNLQMDYDLGKLAHDENFIEELKMIKRISNNGV